MHKIELIKLFKLNIEFSKKNDTDVKIKYNILQR